VYRAVVIDQLSDATLELLDSAADATIATLNADGSPHLSSAWVGVEEGADLHWA
jgi:hypothetical protein